MVGDGSSCKDRTMDCDLLKQIYTGIYIDIYTCRFVDRAQSWRKIQQRVNKLHEIGINGC